VLRFQCSITTPVVTHKGSSYPYQIVVAENVTGVPITAPPYTADPADVNPETVYFKA
jgi:hypothetical protein